MAAVTCHVKLSSGGRSSRSHFGLVVQVVNGLSTPLIKLVVALEKWDFESNRVPEDKQRDRQDLD